MTGGERGFSLIETLVALSLMALVAASVYGVFRVGLTSGERATHAVLATRLAQSKIEQLAGPQTIAAGMQSGATEEGFRWQLEVVPLGDDMIADATIPSALVTVTVAWQEPAGAKSYRLRTIRLLPAPETR